jgi:hypothetical protein
VGEEHGDGDLCRRPGGRQGWLWHGVGNPSWPLYQRGVLHSTSELYTGELHTPISIHSETARKYYAKSACCKHMFQVFQMLQRYVANFLCGCCKSRLGCCTCCNSCTRMLQVSVPNVFIRVFYDVSYKCVYLDVAYVFRLMLQVFYLDVAYVLQWFLSVFRVFFASVLDACLKMFHLSSDLFCNCYI